MPATDPILAAKTVAEFCAAADVAYHLDLPTAFPDGTQLAVMWALPVVVAKDPAPTVLYRATATAPFAVAAGFAATVTVELVATGAGSALRRHISLHRKDQPSWPSRQPPPRARQRHRPLSSPPRTHRAP